MKSSVRVRQSGQSGGSSAAISTSRHAIQLHRCLHGSNTTSLGASKQITQQCSSAAGWLRSRRLPASRACIAVAIASTSKNASCMDTMRERQAASCDLNPSYDVWSDEACGGGGGGGSRGSGDGGGGGDDRDCVTGGGSNDCANCVGGGCVGLDD